MSPEFGATATLFPIDDETLSYLRLTGRTPERVDLVERYAKEQGLWREPGEGPVFDELLTLDLATVEPSVAGPRRPQDRVPLQALRDNFRTIFPDGLEGPGAPPTEVATGDTVHEASAESFPASDAPAFARSESVAAPAPPAPAVADPSPRRGSPRVPSGRGHGRRRDREGELRVGRDRGHHVLHQHLESDGDDRGRTAGTERRGAWVASGAHGQDVTGAGLARRDRLSRGRRVDGPARTVGLRAGWIRLHDLHRQLGPARCAGRRSHRGERPRGRGSAVGQPQLRGADPSPRARELPGVTPAGRGVRAGRAGGCRPHDRSAGYRIRWATGPPCRHLAIIRRDPCGDRIVDRSRAVPQHLRGRVRGRRSVAGAAHPVRRPLRLGSGLDLRGEAALLRW